MRKLIDRILKGSFDATNMVQPLRSVPNMENNIFLFLGGLHRSGTSILHRLLREHKSVSGFANTAAAEDEGQHLQTVFPPAMKFGGPGRFAFDPESHLTESSHLVSVDNKEKLLREWGAYYDLEKRVLLEKSPPNLVRSRFFQEFFPRAQFVFIIRHPIAVSLATQKFSKTSIVELMLHWYLSHRILFDDVKHVRNSMIFRYEDFLGCPEFYIDKICQFVGIDLFKPEESVKDHNSKYFSSWQPGYQNDRELLSKVFPEFINFMSQFGYSLYEPYVTELGKEKFLNGIDLGN